MSDWGGYKSLLLEAKADADAERGKPPEACPQCGEPLQQNGRGVLNCPLGHFRQVSR